MIAGRPYRVGIVGAASLAGRELADCVPESPLAESDVVLLDEVDSGQLTTSGDEVTFIQKIDSDSFVGMDFVFFVDSPETTKKYWKAARAAGASIVDMTYALEHEAGVVVRAPWTGLSEDSGRRQEPDLTTPAVVAAHPAAVMLSLVANRLRAKFPLRAVSATVFEPASEHGRLAMDELHQQTVSLLSFQTLPREQFGGQVAFNLAPALGEAAKVNLPATKQRIGDHYSALSPGVSSELALELVQAPVFHGYVASVLIEIQESAMAEQVELAISGEHVDVVSSESDPPSNLSAAGQPDVLVRVSSGSGKGAASKRLWLWLAADNLKLAALNAITCATELGRLRPQGKVQ